MRRTASGARDHSGVHMRVSQQRIEELAGMRDALARLIETCDQPRPERDCPVLQNIEIAAETTAAQD